MRESQLPEKNPKKQFKFPSRIFIDTKIETIRFIPSKMSILNYHSDLLVRKQFRVIYVLC